MATPAQRERRRRKRQRKRAKKKEISLQTKNKTMDVVLNTKRRNVPQTSTPIKQYALAMRDPFHIPPPLVGMGTMLPLSRFTAFRRTVVSLAANTYTLFVTDPSASSILTYFSTTNSASLWNAATVTTLSANNVTNLNTRYQTARMVSGGIRLRALNAATNAPPVIYGGNIFDSKDNIAGLVVGATTGESQLEPSFGANLGVQVVFTPSDLSDYNLLSATMLGFATAVAIVHSVIYFKTTVAIDVVVEVMYHGEGNSGVDVVGEDDDVPSLATTTSMSLESVMKTGAVDNVFSDVTVTQSTLIDKLSKSMTPRGPHGLSLRSEGGHIPVVSSSTVAKPSNISRDSSVDYSEFKQ